MKSRSRIRENQPALSDILDILCAPGTHERLELRESNDGDMLVGKETGVKFAIRDGIPLLIDSSGLSASSETSRKFYDVLAPIYEFAQTFYYTLAGGEKNARLEYLRYLDVKPADRVLEVSSGNGVNLRHLPRTAEYFGIDISFGQLKRCLRNLGKSGLKARIFQSDAEKLPFVDNAFDVVFNIGSVNYYGDRRRAIGEMVRVAKPGGTLLIADETAREAKRHDRIPIYRGFFHPGTRKTGPPVDDLPRNVAGVTLDEIRNGNYFCLSFRKEKTGGEG